MYRRNHHSQEFLYDSTPFENLDNKELTILMSRLKDTPAQIYEKLKVKKAQPKFQLLTQN